MARPKHATPRGNRSANMGRTRKQTPQDSPATCEMDYTPEQSEFLRAAERYRQDNHLQSLRACHYLAVAVELGYRRP